MEHRLHQREAVDMEVRLIENGQVVTTVRALDLSPDGVGIETPGIALQAGHCVTVDLCKPGHPRGVSCCFNAMVVHCGPKSTGLMFTSEGALNVIAHLQGKVPESNG